MPTSDDLQRFLSEAGASMVDPAAEYYDDYYAIFFLDPDGLTVEGMTYREKTVARKKRRKAAG